MAKAGNSRRKSRVMDLNPAEQFAEARCRIEEAKERGDINLDLGELRIATLPPQIAGLTALEGLELTDTQVSDLTPIAGLTALESLELAGTQVSDLAPIAGLTDLQSLDLAGTPVSDLAPIAHLTSLERLYLAGTQVSDLASIAGLTYLEDLCLDHTRVGDLAPIAGLTALEDLLLRGTPVSDLAPIADHAYLKRIFIGGTPVQDLAPLTGLTDLGVLDLGGTQVRDLAPIAGLTALKILILSGTQIRDLAPLAGLTALIRLSLGGTQVSDLTPLARLTSLQKLDLADTLVSDLAPLARLTALHSLSISGTQVSDLAPLARMKELVRSVNMEGRFPTEGLKYSETPASRITPFDRLVRLEPDARTVETINEVRRRRGLREYSAPRTRYEPPPGLDDLLSPRPTTRLMLVHGRVDIVAPAAWEDRKAWAAVYHTRARKHATDLADRLVRTDAPPDVVACVAAIGDVLGNSIEDIRPEQLILAARSVAAKARAWGHSGPVWEIIQSLNGMSGLADVLVDLESFAKADVG